MSFFIDDYSFTQFLRDIGTGCAYQVSMPYLIRFWPVILFAVTFLGGGFFFFRVLADPGDDKRRAWVPSLLSSSFMFACCAPLFCKWAFYEAPTEGLAGAANRLTEADWFSDSAIVFFNTFLWFDMIVSGIFFPSHMELLAGWIHHIVYVCLCSNALYWKWTKGFSIMFIEELPTLLLALGRCYPMFQTELGFGVTFAVLRLGLHTFISIVATIYCRHTSFLWLAAWLALVVHLWWFTGWLSRQGKLMREQRRVSLLPPDDPRKEELLRKVTVASRDYRLDSVLLEDETQSRRKSRKMSDFTEQDSLLEASPVASP
eukprot:Protomagalhaensia_wolfi_Nauph_80__244@NODE_1139_length_1703_cov_44_954327_g869_i0_p1_GENE_NODE_1139_length_1703_cov_44_954327_g869_i0NODE_1139_length_1703_cov_44_954327_g869_i0_p1_ORF_typecomplete_len316_score66_63TRAM_LAG1_CLN8/PF03798_16/1e04TRAM_LAG1_CLN8/PF03798_16/2_2e05DUF4131/PF13567_6/5DUF4131/PF13567_6/7_6DUF2621/PF11084_8/0_84DUF2621/PF11084_8/2_7e03_NODE_1139_length_1703_cov_44_954327_g869_i05271474